MAYLDYYSELINYSDLMSSLLSALTQNRRNFWMEYLIKKYKVKDTLFIPVKTINYGNERNQNLWELNIKLILIWQEDEIEKLLKMEMTN